jgi:hypothetical protein
VTTLGAGRARGADPVPGPVKRRQILKPFRPYSDRSSFSPELIDLYKSDLSERTEMRCLRAALPAYRRAEFMKSFSTLGKVN